jgi:hypothetical protein
MANEDEIGVRRDRFLRSFPHDPLNQDYPEFLVGPHKFLKATAVGRQSHRGTGSVCPTSSWMPIDLLVP